MAKQSKTATPATPAATETDTKPAPALSVSVDHVAMALTFTFGNGESFIIKARDLPDEIQGRAMLHGLEQKVRDAAAIGYALPNGKTRRPTVAEKYKACLDVATRLTAGQWNATKAGVESGGMIWQAFDAVKPGKFADAAEFHAWVDGQAEARKVSKNAIHDALKRDPRIAAELDRIRSARGTATVDVTDLMDELDA